MTNLSTIRKYWPNRPTLEELLSFEQHLGCELESFGRRPSGVGYTAHFRKLAQTATMTTETRKESKRSPNPTGNWTSFSDQYPEYGHQYKIRHIAANVDGDHCTYECTYIRLEDGGQFIIKQFLGYGRNSAIDEIYMKPSQMTQFHAMEWQYI